MTTPVSELDALRALHRAVNYFDWDSEDIEDTRDAEANRRVEIALQAAEPSENGIELRNQLSLHATDLLLIAERYLDEMRDNDQCDKEAYWKLNKLIYDIGGKFHHEPDEEEDE